MLLRFWEHSWSRYQPTHSHDPAANCIAHEPRGLPIRCGCRHFLSATMALPGRQQARSQSRRTRLYPGLSVSADVHVLSHRYLHDLHDLHDLPDGCLCFRTANLRLKHPPIAERRCHEQAASSAVHRAVTPSSGCCDEIATRRGVATGLPLHRGRQSELLLRPGTHRCDGAWGQDLRDR